MGLSHSKDTGCCCSGARDEDKFGGSPKKSPPTYIDRQYLLIDNDNEENQDSNIIVACNNKTNKHNNNKHNNNKHNNTQNITTKPTSNLLLLSESPPMPTSKKVTRSNKTNTKEENPITAFSPNGKIRCSTGGGEKRCELTLWETKSGKRIKTLQGNHRISHISFSPNGNLLRSTSEPNNNNQEEIRLWDINSLAGNKIVGDKKNQTPVRSGLEEYDELTKKWLLEFSIKEKGNQIELGSNLFTSLVEDSTSTVATAKQAAKTPSSHHLLFQHSGKVQAVAYSPDGVHIASADATNTLTTTTTTTTTTTSKKSGAINIWNSKNGIITAQCLGHKGGTYSISYSPGGSKLISGGYDRMIKMWDTYNGELIHTYEGHLGSITTVSFSLDGEKICSSSEDESIRVWKTWTRTCLRIFDGHLSMVTSVAFSPNGEQLCSCGMDGRVQLWNYKDGDEAPPAMTLFDSPCKIAVNDVAWSPDSSYIVAGCDDNIKIWDTKTGAYLMSLKGHKSKINSVLFNSNGALIVSCSDDGTAKVWDMEQNGKCIKTQPEEKQDGCLHVVMISPNNEWVCTGSESGNVRQFRL